MSSKVLLVEDDNNLREIYQARLQAEGYDIVSAKDGEEALVIAKREQPDLIISDVMMPRVSGFEMLDILRNTQGLKAPKVIMLTALGQADDKTRADQLGADRYLVKSQVTLEDIVKAAQELLTSGSSNAGDDIAAVVSGASGSSTSDDDTDASDAAVEPEVVDTPMATPPAEPPAVVEPTEPKPTLEPIPETPITSDATPAPTTPGTQSVVTAPVEADPDEKDPNEQLIADALKDLTNPDSSDQTEVNRAADSMPAADATQGPSPVESPAAPLEPAAAPAPSSSSNDENDESSTVTHKKVIKPISQPAAGEKADINDLLAKEEAKAPSTDMSASAPRIPAQDVHAIVPAHPPGHVIAPAPATAQPSPVESPAASEEKTTVPVSPPHPTSAASEDVDPNQVAL